MYKYDIFLICPVRNATEEQKIQMKNYILECEKAGFSIYYPDRDTDQNDSNGIRICRDNRKAMKSSKFVHLFWDRTSQGSLFDLGMAFMASKKLKIVNPETLQVTAYKSFDNMLKVWEAETR
jgi:hypothetical protein